MRLPSGAVPPDYAGGGIANLAPSIARALGAAPGSAGIPLAARALPPEALDGVERVVLVVVDGLGWNQLQRLARDGTMRALPALAGSPITSVAPSTTSAALATLATGLPPIAHGILGYRMHLPAFGLTANMIRLQGVVGGNLESAGLDLSELFPFPTLYERLALARVRSEAVTRAAYMESALTRMIYRGATLSGFLHVGDLFVRGRRLLEAMRGERGLLRLYYDGIDTVAHAAGPRSDEHDATAAVLDGAIERELLGRVRDPGALLLVTADHGHVHVAPERHVRFSEHPGLTEHLVLPPSGEGRFAYLHVRAGHEDAVRAYVASTWSREAALLSIDEAARGGLFGPGAEHPEFRRRAGDLLLVAKDDWKFETEYGPARAKGTEKERRILLGNHGGLSADEMLVPLLWKRL